MPQHGQQPESQQARPQAGAGHGQCHVHVHNGFPAMAPHRCYFFDQTATTFSCYPFHSKKLRSRRKILMLLPACLALTTLLPIDFALSDLHGRTRSLSEWRDKRMVVLAFLSADCPVSRLYAQRLEELAQEFDSRGVTVIAIDPDADDSAASLRKMQTELRLTYPVLRDPKQALARRLFVKRTPEVVVLDQVRRVRYQGRV